MSRPFAAGHGGHARSCDCGTCARARVEAALALHRKFGSAAEVHATKTVFVRAYWRRDPRHLARMPTTRALLKAELRRLAKPIPKW